MSTLKSFDVPRYLGGTPSAPTVTPTRPATPANVAAAPGGATGATTITYKVVARKANTQYSAPGAATPITNSNNTIDGTNFNTVTWDAVAGMGASDFYDVYRIRSGQSDKLVASVAGNLLTANDTGGTTVQSPEAAVTTSYYLVFFNSAGQHTVRSTIGTTANGYAAPSATLPHELSWGPLSSPTSFYTGVCQIYRSVGGVSQGLIGTVANGVTVFTDTGQTGDGTTAPTTNTSGMGLPLNVSALGVYKTVQLTGMGTQTVQIQGSLDGVNWVNDGSALTADGKVDTSSRWEFMRTNMTSYSSGGDSIAGKVAG